ncbi:ATPase, T2SS/T4P/T4SS family [Solemya velesiana gill symbiont]|uniref:Bacterial type II secretion system protein E domain-containing protein n=1 Tax=Solemya velesiana gill symbiont TaxID=1918948 RepID=A0A1T2KMB4_9GAMM|nr:ATPase, T2SS/T4P/T4SS family [Solemya velesiana gill symbiont]OOZ33975.1 hypothetical protein BOW51_12385 [Solemya velesiana gill symbiont]
MGRLERLTRKLQAELGNEIVSALKDGSVTDIYLNDDGAVWVHRVGEAKKVLTQMSATQADNLIRTVASMSGGMITDKRPVVEARLPNGERFIGDMAPISRHPTFCIRKPARVVYTLESYVGKGMMTEAQHQAITEAVTNRKNILVVGGTGSGKTTLTAIVDDALLFAFFFFFFFFGIEQLFDRDREYHSQAHGTRRTVCVVIIGKLNRGVVEIEAVFSHHINIEG